MIGWLGFGSGTFAWPNNQIFARFTQNPPTPSIDEFVALAPVDANASKPPLASETLCTIAA